MLNIDYFLHSFPAILKILEKPYMVFTVFQGLRVGMGGLRLRFFGQTAYILQKSDISSQLIGNPI